MSAVLSDISRGCTDFRRVARLTPLLLCSVLRRLAAVGDGRDDEMGVTAPWLRPLSMLAARLEWMWIPRGLMYREDISAVSEAAELLIEAGVVFMFG